MHQAIRLAREAVGAGDVPVGAVVVDADGAVLGTGANAREVSGDPSAHAEIVALRAAAEQTGTWRLSGTTLVVTLEPCVMCAGALVQARLDRVVFGADDPKAGAVGSVWDMVRDPRNLHRPEVLRGVLAQECAEPLRAFFSQQRRD
ncbi:MAG TPA: tRNA adenosine(34) deaminase TadA [Jiangellaceae bacterium]|nr:tRNA adenosine(34) deaminase TadA [Jiangellaceae bacterium]